MELKIRDFILSVFKFSIATWVNFIVGLLMTIVTTRFFDEETYAIINIFNTATTTGMTIVCLGLDSGYIRFFHEPPSGDDQKQLVFKLMLIASLINFVLGLILLAGYYREFSKLLFNRVSLLFCVVLFLNIHANIVVRFLNITYRMRLDAKGYTIQNILFQSLSRIVIIGAAFFNANDTWTISLSTIGMLLLATIYTIVQRKDIFPKDITLRYKGYKEVFKYSVFSAPTAIIINLNTLITNLIVKEKLGLRIAGVYSSTVTIALIISVLQGGFSTFWSGYMFANYRTAQNISRKVHDFFMLGIFVLYIGLVLFKDFIFMLVGKDFQSGRDIFPLLLIYPLLTLAIETTGYGVSIAKKSYITMLSYLSCLTINVAFSYLLADSLGINGVALSSSIGAFVLFFLLTEIAQRYYKTITKKGRTYLTLLVIEMIALVDTFCKRTVGFYCLLWAGVLFIGIVFRMEISMILKQIINILKKEKHDI